jgi:hypothetical protein
VRRAHVGSFPAKAVRGPVPVSDAPPTIVNARVIPWELEGAYGYGVAVGLLTADRMQARGCGRIATA